MSDKNKSIFPDDWTGGGAASAGKQVPAEVPAEAKPEHHFDENTKHPLNLREDMVMDLLKRATERQEWDTIIAFKGLLLVTIVTCDMMNASGVKQDNWGITYAATKKHTQSLLDAGKAHFDEAEKNTGGE